MRARLVAINEEESRMQLIRVEVENETQSVDTQIQADNKGPLYLRIHHLFEAMSRVTLDLDLDLDLDLPVSTTAGYEMFSSKIAFPSNHLESFQKSPQLRVIRNGPTDTGRGPRAPVPPVTPKTARRIPQLNRFNSATPRSRQTIHDLLLNASFCYVTPSKWQALCAEHGLATAPEPSRVSSL